MRILVACEFSGRVRDAFRSRGHDAWSCDIEPTESDPLWHYQCDVRVLLRGQWDLMIAFPPCTHLSNLNAFHGRQGTELEDTALDFVCDLMNAPIPRIAIENPMGAINRRIRRQDQVIHPFYFGDPWRKQTCLWLKNLPALVPTSDMAKQPRRNFRSWTDAPGLTPETRARIRGMTFPGVASAMASQWGG